jgi:YgiT-type zinc finger domain-containing protein
MQCGICKGKMEEGLVSYTEDMDDCVVVIRKVPAFVCSECGNVWYAGTVVSKLESMVNSIAQAKITDVAVVNYQQTA